MKKISLLLLCGLALAGCSPKLTANLFRTATPLAYDDLVLFLDKWTPAPAEAEYYGSIEVNDMGDTYVSDNELTVFYMAEAKAREIGANVIDITEEHHPGGVSDVYKIKAGLFHLDDVERFVYEVPATEKHPDYAAVYFYRNNDYWPLVVYDVRIGDQKVYRSKKFSAAEVKIYEPGKVRIWAKLEKEAEITLNLELGKDYFIECGVAEGTFYGNPSFEVAPDGLGHHIYNAVKAKNQ